MKGGTGIANYDRVYRAYFSAINPSDIQKAYQALGKPDKNQSLSVDARQELDLKIGVAFSRFQSRYFQGRYGDLNSAVVSYGPCQTPTLGFCVQRHIDIETFKPEPCTYRIQLGSLSLSNAHSSQVVHSLNDTSFLSTDWVLELGILKRGRILRATWEAGRSFNKSNTEGLIEKALEAHATVAVSSVVIKEKKQGRPTPMNTVALLKACSKALGIGPHATMQAAERLYLR
jgi:DNA topoisomerase-3